MSVSETTRSRVVGYLLSWSWVHLIYVVFLFFQPGFNPEARWWDWALAGTVAGLIIVIYLSATWRPGNLRWRATVPMLVIGIIATPFNSAASVVLVYAAAFAAGDESRRDALRWFAGLSSLAVVMTFFSATPMPYRLWSLLPPLLLIWVIGISQLDDTDRERAAQALRLRSAKIEHLATIAERERIARDLHDLLGHSLTAVVVRAQLVRELAAVDPERAGAEAAEIERTARGALDEVRSAVTGWRQANLDAELDAGRGALASVGVELTVHREPGLELLGSTEHELAGVVREALTNVAKHSGARHCTARIGSSAGELRLTIEDDGAGLSRGFVEGNGLSGIRERVSFVGGTVTLSGKQGTRMTVVVPLEVAV